MNPYDRALAVLDQVANATNDTFRLVGSQLQKDAAEARDLLLKTATPPSEG